MFYHGILKHSLKNMIYQNVPKPFETIILKNQTKNFMDVGFTIIQAQEAYLPIKFF